MSSSFRDRQRPMPSLTAAGFALVAITAVMGVVLAALLVSLLRMSRLVRAAKTTTRPNRR